MVLLTGEEAELGPQTVLCSEAVGEWLWCGHRNGVVTVRDPRSGRLEHVLRWREHAQAKAREKGKEPPCPTTLAAVFDGALVWVGWRDGRITVADAQSFESLGGANSHVDRVNAIISHEHWAFSASDDTLIHRYPLEGPDIIPPIKNQSYSGHTAPVKALTAAGDALVSGSADQTARVWSCSSGACLLVLSFSCSPQQPLASIRRELQELCDEVTTLRLQEGSQHFSHLLPDVLHIKGDAKHRKRHPLPKHPPKHLPPASYPKRSSAPKPHPTPPKPHPTPPKPHPTPPLPKVSPKPPIPPAAKPRVRKQQKVQSPPRHTRHQLVDSVPPPSRSPTRTKRHPPRHIPSPVTPSHSPSPSPRPPFETMRLAVDKAPSPVTVNVTESSRMRTRRGLKAAWGLQLRNELRLLRRAYKTWHSFARPPLGPLEETALIMEGIAHAAVLLRYFGKLLVLACGVSPEDDESSVTSQRVPTTRAGSSTPMLEIPLPPPTDPTILTVLLPLVPLLVHRPNPRGPYAPCEDLPDFLSAVKRMRCELLVWVDADQAEAENLVRTIDSPFRAVSHVLARPPSSAPLIHLTARSPATCLFIESTPDVHRSMACRTAVLPPYPDSNVLQLLVNLLHECHGKVQCGVAVEDALRESDKLHTQVFLDRLGDPVVLYVA